MRPSYRTLFLVLAVSVVLAGAAIGGRFYSQHVYWKGFHDGEESGRFYGHLDGMQEGMRIERDTCEKEEQLREANRQALAEMSNRNAGRKK
jgi:hypothetical protein